MKPVYQTRFRPGTSSEPHLIGNCFAACIASIFEVSLEELPDLTEAVNICSGDPTKGWELHWIQLNNWLFVNYGLCMLDLDASVMEKVSGFTHQEHCYFIAAGPTDRCQQHHAVVYKNNVMVHDPHPQSLLDGGGLEEIKYYTFFLHLGSKSCSPSS